MLAWNVNGLTDSKKDCNDFVKLITANDIVFLFETWTNRNSKIEIEGYVSFNFYRKYQHRKAKRSSCGVAVYFKESLKDGIAVVRNSYDSVIWLKLDKVFFRTENDVYLCGVYVWPEDSPVYNVFDIDLFDVVQNDVYDFENKGSVYLMGDWNSRVGSRDDYIIHDNNVNNVDDFDYIADIPLARASADKTYNSFGLKLLDLCKSTGFRIINGRLSNDAGNGSYTFASRQGASVIDYVLARECDFVHINDFMVHDFNEWSDHCPISMSIHCNILLHENDTFSFTRLKWSDVLKEKFRSGLISKLPNFNHLAENINVADKVSINSVVSEFTNIVREIADPLFTRHIIVSKESQYIDNPVNDKDWFDNECLQPKQRYMEALRVFKQCKSDHSRNMFCNLKLEYKKVVKKKKRSFELNQLSSLENLRFSKPKEFWKFFKSNS